MIYFNFVTIFLARRWPISSENRFYCKYTLSDPFTWFDKFVIYFGYFWICRLVFRCLLKQYERKLCNFIGWFVSFVSTMRFQMPPQIVCPRGCKVTLVAFVWLFSSVCLQMCPQMVWIRGCIITLVAFVWLFSTVRFQMGPQSACIRRCKITLVALVWLFSTVCFQMSP